MNYDASYVLSKDWQLGTIELADKTHLRYGLYPSSRQPPTKGLVFLNGRTEFIEKYHYFVEDLQLPKHSKLLTWDHRGQGGSSGLRSYIDSYDTYAADANLLITQLLGANTPYCALAHSMGALICLYASLRGFIKPQKIVLSSPFLGIPERPLPKSLTRYLAYGAAIMGFSRQRVKQKSLKLTDFANNPLTNCNEKFARILASPYPATSVSFGWLKASFQALDVVFDPAYLCRLEVPVYILCAADELVVSAKAIFDWCELAQRYSKGSIECEIIDGSKHELLSERPIVYDKSLEKIRSLLHPWFEL